MLFNDFIGFHTKEYCDNYLEALQEWFPVEIRTSGKFYEVIYQNHITTIGAFPIGLDVDKILSEVSVKKKIKYRVGGEDLYEKISRDRKSVSYIFGGLERLDYTKGFVERLNIFQDIFHKLRESGKSARLYQVTAPSRSDNPDYKKLTSILEEKVLRMNEEMEGCPIVHIDKGIPVPQNYRFMKEIDVMLVTPLEDGMNLVAFEYILSQKYKHYEDRGILMLSTSGASRVLKQKGYGEKDGVVFVDPMKAKDAGRRTVEAMLKGRHISDQIIQYVEKERRVDEWAEENINAILDCRKSV
jgi:trehalose-6-phosphate synthase